MNRLLLIRHGSTAGNLQRRYIGRTDEPLCEAGILQVLALKERHLPADRVFASPMLRTRQTAELLFPMMPHTVVADFREMDFGQFEGKTSAELSGNASYRCWVDSWCRDPTPGGESAGSFQKRTCAAFRRVMNTVSDGETAVFVVHGGTIMSIMEAYAVPHRDYFDYHIGTGQMLSCTYQNGVIEF